MTRYYDVLNEHNESFTDSGGQDTTPPDCIKTNPYPLIAVWRHRYPVTFDRRQGASFSKDFTDAVRLRETTLIIVDDVQSLSINATKTNHLNQLNATLLSGMNYLTEIFPGDWIASWMVYGESDLRDLIDRILNGSACNKFNDGLKFLGKASSLRKKIQQNANGKRISRYELNAVGFSEFDAEIYFEPYLASEAIGPITDWLRQTGLKINELIKSNGQGIDINNIIPLLIDAFYGAGIPKDLGISDNTLPITAGLDNPNAMIVPDQVAAILGVTSGTKTNGKKGWTDILEILQGIQQYSSISSEGYQGPNVGAIFTPDGVNTNADNRKRKTKNEMMGTFLPSPPQFTGQRTVWSILQQYLNPAVNEMFTCLRVNPQGNIFPTFIVRQLPFNSGVLGDIYTPAIGKDVYETEIKQKAIITEAKRTNNKKLLKETEVAQEALQKFNGPRQLILTRFMELPRWRIHSSLLMNVDFGRSDALRFNFIHVYPETGLAGENRTGWIVRNPPIRDDLDIARNGLRPYMMSVNCAPEDARNLKAGEWMYILSDILMGQHLTLTGSMETAGIRSPICPGDNIEFDNHVFHIESISHRFNITSDGVKTFRTYLTLTRGMKVEQADGGTLSLYSGSSNEDLTRYDAGHKKEYTLSPSPSSTPSEGSFTTNSGDFNDNADFNANRVV